MKHLPLLPFPLQTSLKISHHFISISSKLVKFFPNLSLRLIQAEMPIKDREYASLAIFAGVFYFIVIFSPLSVIALAKGFVNFAPVILFSSLAISLVSFLYMIFYPNLIVAKKTREIDKNLIFALRHLLVQIKSGITLYDGLVSLAKGNYGLLSKGFAKATNSISTGTDEIEAL